MKTTDSAQVEKIVLAGGCFWGTQRLLSLLHGVRRTRAGFANSEVENPTYKEVCTGTTGAVEAVEVEYNATVVDLPKLLDFFLKSIDPTAKDRQGNDPGYPVPHRHILYHRLAEAGGLGGRGASSEEV